ncbi:MAG: type II secretion system F family protein [Candidatus Thermoplasmatota archaeon]|nr:type II secretion system F family protein [Candidatus Thermoplasmatota archaeon]MED6306043.1 type II secretion system F family protein [Candidatus Thermoplasmatota archaeon]MEE3242774.1 type II secretion system F family protein [Candidatus Thermoplasmatota archaeon]
MASVDQELLYAIRAIEIMLESGVGVAEAMKHVADEDYGDLSGVFRQIFADTDSGRNFGDAVRTQMRSTDSSGLRKLLSALAMSIEEDTNVIDRLRSIADKEARERRVELESFIEGLTATSEQFLIVSILIPIIVVIGAVVNGLVESAKAAGGGFMGNTPTMPDACVPALFIIATISIAGLVIQTKSREPKV